jgi:hypothetical protein
VLFYAVNVHRAEPAARPPQRKVRRPDGVRTSKPDYNDPVVDELIHALEQIGMPDVPPSKVRAALAETHPDGYRDVPTNALLTDVFRHLSRQDSRDNVT